MAAEQGPTCGGHELPGLRFRKVWRQLAREGVEVARCTVSRLMRGGVIRIKEAIQRVDSIKKIQSTASEGNASVMVELEPRRRPPPGPTRPRTNIDAVTTFPLETEKPIIREMTNRN